jgi:hypothetical protein
MAITAIVSMGARIASNLGGGGTSPTNQKLAETVTGTPAFAAHPDGVANHYGCHVVTNTTHFTVKINSTDNQHRLSFRWRPVANPATASPTICGILSAAGVVYFVRQLNTGNFPLQVIITGGSATTIIATPVNGTDYWIDLLINMSGGAGVNHTIDSWVDGVAQTQNTFVVGAASTVSTVRTANSSTTGTCDYWVSDVVTYDSGDARLGPHKVYSLVPATGKVGTHSSTAGDFTDDTGAAVNAGETTSWAKLDEWPPNVTDFVRQAVARTTSYLRHGFEALPVSGKAIRAVRLIGAGHPVAAATANEACMRIFDGTAASAEAVWDMSLTSNTAEYHCHLYTTKPTGGAWDDTSITAMRVEHGHSNDVSPAPAWSAFLAEVLVDEANLPVSAGAPPLLAQVV